MGQRGKEWKRKGKEKITGTKMENAIKFILFFSDTISRIVIGKNLSGCALNVKSGITSSSMAHKTVFVKKEVGEWGV